VVKWLTAVIRGISETGQIPPDWRKSIILPLNKGKGSRRECKNYRGITLFSGPREDACFYPVVSHQGQAVEAVGV